MAGQEGGKHEGPKAPLVPMPLPTPHPDGNTPAGGGTHRKDDKK
ncbi:hypothetical protein [Streptomyces litchfieldiae]|uniref:Uncharacterized protein n=1 Tax=Streptomyces litchfieldiae TaxID=3075543 RepID=A0ABU2MRQ6_9ACTN|nr:hypothetical protein [Streptomyces sp. DSM 44938]MDT0343284.1 hypothetical protein [Streptomyces sp. DSM 44938]